MKYLELFEPEPKTWGLRGDPYLWQEIKKRLGEKEIPINQEEIQREIIHLCLDVFNINLNTDNEIFIKDFDKGGMSSGWICCEWWREKGIPLLLSRSNE